MTDLFVDESLELFLRDHVTSHEHLSVLLCFHAGAADTWTPEAMASYVGLPVDVVADVFGDLHRKGLIQVGQGSHNHAFAYAPVVPKLARLVDALSSAHEHQRADVVSVIGRNAVARVREAAQVVRTVESLRSRRGGR